MPEMPLSRPAATRRIPIAIGAVVAVGVIGLGAFYGLGGFRRGTGGDPSCTGAVELARKYGVIGTPTIQFLPFQVSTTASKTLPLSSSPPTAAQKFTNGQETVCRPLASEPVGICGA